MKIYIAASLFSEIEREFNLKLKKFIETFGFETYLPQLDSGLVHDLIDKGVPKEIAKSILFNMDVNAIKNSDILLFVLDGRVPDEGGCVELGIAYAFNKICIGYKTDIRSLVGGDDNLMIWGILRGKIAKNFSELQEMMLSIKEKGKLSFV